MFSRRNCLKWMLGASSVALSPGLSAQTKPPGPQDKVLQLLVQPADKKTAPRVVAEFDLAGLKKLPQQTFATNTPWFKQPVKFTGPLMRDVLATAKLQGTTLIAVALDEYKAKIPFSDAGRFDVILAHSINGEQMTAKNKGPLFIVYPYDSQKELQTVLYYQRSVWQLKALIVE